MSRIIRVFPRRTSATPNDDLARTGLPMMWDEADAVHVSVAFTWDLPRAERLAEEWEHVAPVAIGGPATGSAGSEFTPGRYLKPGYVITSRGCPNQCWFCDVWRREGPVRELPISDGWNVLDDNLLACSDGHIHRVFAMLRRVRTSTQRVQFSGGLEAARLRPWHVDELLTVRPKQMFFAHDTPDDLDPLYDAGRMLLDAGWTRRSKTLRCYVLCGYPQDTLGGATARMLATVEAGFTPMAMLYRDATGQSKTAWRRFQRQWARPGFLKNHLHSQD